MPGLCLVAHRGVPIDRVAVPPAHALDHHKARLDEIGDDPLGRALGDAHHLGDVRVRTFGSRAMQRSTWVWFVRNRQGLPLA